MSSPYCNVALPVPLRTAFTYAVPEALREVIQPGSRVLVPFRKKSLVGVVVDFVERAPEGTRIREITKALGFAPALTPKLIELAQWIAAYYLAPIGEVFRAMLPPVTELKTKRQIQLTEAGREAAESLSGGELSHGLTGEEAEFLANLKGKRGVLQLGRAARLGVDGATLQRLQRRGLIEIRESVEGRERKTQRVIAWKVTPEDRTRDERAEKEEKVRALLETERGPLPLPQLLRLAGVSRALVERMLRDGLLESWEEPIDPAEDPFDAGYEPPAHELNPEPVSYTHLTLPTICSV